MNNSSHISPSNSNATVFDVSFEKERNASDIYRGNNQSPIYESNYESSYGSTIDRRKVQPSNIAPNVNHGNDQSSISAQPFSKQQIETNEKNLHYNTDSTKRWHNVTGLPLQMTSMEDDSNSLPSFPSNHSYNSQDLSNTMDSFQTLKNDFFSILQDMCEEKLQDKDLQSWIDFLLMTAREKEISIPLLNEFLEEIDKKMVSCPNSKLDSNFMFQLYYLRCFLSYFVAYFQFLQNQFVSSVETILYHFQSSFSCLEKEPCWKNMMKDIFSSKEGSSPGSKIAQRKNIHHSEYDFPSIEDVDESIYFYLICILIESFICISNIECAYAVHNLYIERFSSVLQLPSTNVSHFTSLSSIIHFFTIQEAQLFALATGARLALLIGDITTAEEYVTEKGYQDIGKCKDDRLKYAFLLQTPAFIQFKMVESLLYAEKGEVGNAITTMEFIRDYIPESIYLHHIANFFKKKPYIQYQLLAEAQLKIISENNNDLTNLRLKYNLGLSLLHLKRSNEAHSVIKNCLVNEFNKPIIWIRLTECILEEMNEIMNILWDEQASTKLYTDIYYSHVILPVYYLSPSSFEPIMQLLQTAKSYLNEALNYPTLDEQLRLEILSKQAYILFELEEYSSVLESTITILNHNNSSENQRFLATLLHIASLTILKESESLLQFIQNDNIIDYYHINQFLDPQQLKEESKVCDMPTELLFLVLLVSEVANGNLRDAEYRLLQFIQVTIMSQTTHNSINNVQKDYLIKRWTHIMNIFILVIQDKLSDAIRFARSSKDFPPVSICKT